MHPTAKRHRRVPLYKLRQCDCKWPVEEVKRAVGGFLFCAQMIQPGSVYCPEHHEHAYNTAGRPAVRVSVEPAGA